MQTCSSKSKEIVHVQHYYIIFDGKCFNIEEIKEHLIQKDFTNFDNDLEGILNLYSIYKENKFIKEKYYELKSKMHMDNYDETILNVRNIVTESIEAQVKDLDEFGAFFD